VTKSAVREAKITPKRRLKGVFSRPIFVRLPKPGGRCPFSGLSRSALVNLCVPNKANDFHAPVKSVELKFKKHAKRGARLIDYESLMTYLRGLRKEAA
jgi:hypothetical protein